MSVEVVRGGQRRIDRVLDPRFVAGVGRLDLAELRARREEAEAEEADISFLRRLLQGRLDILRAELVRRSRGGEQNVAGLLAGLPAILTDDAPGTFSAIPRILVPSRADQHRRRVERGLPRVGRELTDDVLAEEAGLLGSHVHLDKGCYPGQETVARVHNLGHVQRRLAGLRFGPGGPPTPMTDLVTEDGRRAGQLRSVVDHPELGPIGLAYVRRTVEAGDVVVAGGHPATVVALPFR